MTLVEHFIDWWKMYLLAILFTPFFTVVILMELDTNEAKDICESKGLQLGNQKGQYIVECYHVNDNKLFYSYYDRRSENGIRS